MFFLAFLAQVSALSISSPRTGESLTSPITVSWTSVSSDSTSFDIQLARSTDSSQFQTLASGVSPASSSRSFAVSGNGNYTVNFVSTTQQNSGILAQSGWFLINATASGGSASVSGSARASATASVSGSSAGAVVGTPVSATSASGTSGARSGAGRVEVGVVGGLLALML